MKFFFDFFPVIAFLVTYKAGKLIYHLQELEASFIATSVLMGASALQIFSIYLSKNKPNALHWVTFGVANAVGALSLILRNQIIFQWRPTVMDGALGLGCIASQWIGTKTLIERMMGKTMKLPSAVWRRLNMAWALFFLFSGGLNLVVVYSLSYDAWVNFKTFGLLGLTMVFAVGQVFFLQKYLVDETPIQTGAKNEDAPPPV